MGKSIQDAIKEIEALKSIDIDDEKLDEILEGVDPNTYDFQEAGNFDSPGYDMYTYAIAYIENDKPKLFTFMQESY